MARFFLLISAFQPRKLALQGLAVTYLNVNAISLKFQGWYLVEGVNWRFDRVLLVKISFIDATP